MPLISSDTIRDISVKSVEMFLNNKIPLSQGLAKQASAYELNSEQIQRAVEATNSIAYLKILELSSDRTVEFPLCKYAEVMVGVTIPELGKQTYVTIKENSDLDFTKFAEYSAPTLNNQEQLVHMIKMASIIERELERLKDRAITIVPELEKIANVIKNDPSGLEKLATITEGKEFFILSTLVYGEVKDRFDTGLFKSAELKEVEKIASLYKEAKEVQAGIDDREELLNRSGLQKQALLGEIGSGIGKVIGSVASAPVKAFGKVIGNSIDNVSSRASAMGAKIKNTVTGQSNPIPAITKKRGIMGIGVLGATAAFDASIYQPGTTKTGTSKDVWNALQRS